MDYTSNAPEHLTATNPGGLGQKAFQGRAQCPERWDRSAIPNRKSMRPPPPGRVDGRIGTLNL